jgi:hypothetical protein
MKALVKMKECVLKEAEIAAAAACVILVIRGTERIA